MKILNKIIGTNKIQTVILPFGSEILNIKYRNNAVTLFYIDTELQSGTSEFEFRLYSNNDTLDFDKDIYNYLGLVEENSIDYHVFYKLVSQRADFR